MQKLIIHGDPGIRKGARIEYDGSEFVCFGINRQCEWYGSEEVQLWCTVGEPDEEEAYERRQYIPMHLDVESTDAEDVTILEASA